MAIHVCQWDLRGQFAIHRRKLDCVVSRQWPEEPVSAGDVSSAFRVGSGEGVVSDIEGIGVTKLGGQQPRIGCQSSVAIGNHVVVALAWQLALLTARGGDLRSAASLLRSVQPRQERRRFKRVSG